MSSSTAGTNWAHGFSGSINELILKRIEEIGKLRSLFGNSFSQSFFVFGEGKMQKNCLLGDFWWMHGEWIIFVSTFCEGDGGAQKIDGSHNLFSVTWGPLPVLYIVVPDQSLITWGSQSHPIFPFQITFWCLEWNWILFYKRIIFLHQQKFYRIETSAFLNLNKRKHIIFIL